MIKLKLSEPRTKAWKQWRVDGNTKAAEHLKALGAGEPTKINEKLYKKQKPVFVKLSHGFCAYCGEEVTSNQPGDIEHFRPKGGVQNLAFKDIQVDYGDGAGLVKHRGYPWLAYDPINLLLSCAGCNRKTKLSNKRYYGKDQRFPVKGDQAFLPQHLGKEQPLLIHPGQVDPSEHLGFNPHTGMLFGLTPEGKCTIRVFGLNLRELPGKRVDVYQTVRTAVWEYMRAYEFAEAGATPKHIERLDKKLGLVKRGQHRFPMVARLAVVAANKQIAAAQARLG